MPLLSIVILGGETPGTLARLSVGVVFEKRYSADRLQPGVEMVMVRKERLELSQVTPLEPKSSASTNSATFAIYQDM
jgi:hypothetical protein